MSSLTPSSNMRGLCYVRQDGALAAIPRPRAALQVQLRQHAAHPAAADALDGGYRHREQGRVALQDSALRQIKTLPCRGRECDDVAAWRRQLQQIPGESLHLAQRDVD